MRHHAGVNTDDQGFGRAPQSPDAHPAHDLVEDDFEDDDSDKDDDGRARARASVARQNRVAALAAVGMALILAFGSGIVVGRATAPVTGSGGLGATGASPAASTPAGSASPGTSPAASDPMASLPSDGSLLGSRSARLTITYWADYQCPFCATFALRVLPQLASRIAAGTVAVLHRDYAFIGSESVDAAIAVRCAGEQARYWAMHDAVYAAQSGENQGAFAPAKLTQIAASVGLDAATFATCSARHDVLVAVLADTAAAIRSSVASTPSIDVGAQRFKGVSDTAAFLAAVDQAAAAGATPGPSASVAPSGDPWSGTATTGRTAGSTTAPVTVQLWMDYQSADGAALVQGLEAGLRTRIGAGKIRVELHDLALLGDESVTAAAAVRCVAAQGGTAWLYSDVLALNAHGAGTGLFTVRNLLNLGARMGLDVGALDACLALPATTAAVTAETAQGKALGLTAGPAVIVKVGDRETARFSGTIDTAKALAAIDAAK
jgi:protein-disulfide isomerase